MSMQRRSWRSFAAAWPVRSVAAGALAVGALVSVPAVPSIAEAPAHAAMVGAPPAAATAAHAAVSTTVPLRGRTVVLDAGHNGGNARNPRAIARRVPAGGFLKACNTTGTSTASGYAEHAFTFDVTERAAALLRARGATVVLTRTNDVGVGPCVDARALSANARRPIVENPLLAVLSDDDCRHELSVCAGIETPFQNEERLPDELHLLFEQPRKWRTACETPASPPMDGSRYVRSADEPGHHPPCSSALGW